MMERTKVHDVPVLRLKIDHSAGELVRSFVRESLVAEDLFSTNSELLANDSYHLWRALCANESDRYHAHIHVGFVAGSVHASFVLDGYDPFVEILAEFAKSISTGSQFSRRDYGVEGWEIVLSRRLAAESDTTVPVIEVRTEPVDQPILIEKPRREDAAAIARCFLAVYGRHYVHAEVFSPKRYWKQVESGALIPMIARNSIGTVVGHVALERAPGANIAERGEAVVLPDYRGQGLLERMTESLTLEALTLGLEGIFAQPVTVHTFSQRNDSRDGMMACALELGVRPEQEVPRGVQIPTAGQRQSLFLMFKFLREPSVRRIYAPKQYHEILSQIYQSLGAEAAFALPVLELTGKSHVVIKMEKSGFGDIRFIRIGPCGSDRLQQIYHDLLDLGVKSLRLSVPLGDPGAPALVDVAREIGFFFSGVAPCFEDGEDALMMQYLIEPLDIDKLQIYADQSKVVAAFVDKDRASLKRVEGS